MKESFVRKLRLGYGIFLSIFTVVIAILFILQVADIYDGGAGSYSREIVGEHLMRILVPVILWLVAAVGGYVLSVVFPYVSKERPASAPQKALKRLKKRIPAGTSEEFLAEKKRFRRMEAIRIAAWSLSAAFGLVSAIIAIVYLSNASHFNVADFPGDTPSGVRINTIIVRMVQNVLPWVAATFLLFIGASLYEHFSAKRELETVKRLLVLGKGAPAERSALLEKRDAALAIAGKWQVKFALRLAVLALAVIFIIVGALDGGFEETMVKAINICTECIGLG